MREDDVTTPIPDPTLALMSIVLTSADERKVRLAKRTVAHVKIARERARQAWCTELGLPRAPKTATEVPLDDDTPLEDWVFLSPLEHILAWAPVPEGWRGERRSIKGETTKCPPCSKQRHEPVLHDPYHCYSALEGASAQEAMVSTQLTGTKWTLTFSSDGGPAKSSLMLVPLTMRLKSKPWEKPIVGYVARLLTRYQRELTKERASTMTPPTAPWPLPSDFTALLITVRTYELLTAAWAISDYPWELMCSRRMDGLYTFVIHLPSDMQSCLQFNGGRLHAESVRFVCHRQGEHNGLKFAHIKNQYITRILVDPCDTGNLWATTKTVAPRRATPFGAPRRAGKSIHLHDVVAGK